MKQAIDDHFMHFKLSASFASSKDHPAQVYVTLSRKQGGLSTTAQAKLSSDGSYEATFDINKDFEMKINGEYEITVRAADYRAEAQAEWKVGTAKIWYKEGLEGEVVNDGVKADYKTLPLIEFSYPPEEKQINLLFPLIGILLLAWAFLGFFGRLFAARANLSNLNFSGFLFLGNLLVILTIFTAFWIEVKLIPTLWLLLFLSVPTFIIAQRALSSADCSIGEYKAVAVAAKKAKNE